MIQKTKLRILSALILFLSFYIPATIFGGTLILPQSSCPAGESVTITVHTDGAMGIVAAEVTLIYDHGEIISADSVSTTSLTYTFSLAYNLSDEEIQIATASPKAIENGNGTFLDVEFSVDENAEPGTVMTLDLYDIAFYDQNGDIMDMYVSPGTITILPQDPNPDIKANGLDGPLEITSGDMLSVTIECDEGGYLDVPADWWLVAHTIFGWYYYDLNTGKWLPGSRVTYQGPLFNLTPPFQVLYSSELPTGSYDFYFGVDGNMNGTLDEPLYYDAVEVNITP